MLKKKFFSYEISTIHSLGSLFNFNISKSNKFSLENANKIGLERFKNSALADSLIMKNVKIYNFGIFELGDSKPINNLYFYPRSFFEEVFSNSIYFSFYYNTNKFSFDGFNAKYLPMENHNKYIFEKLTDSIKKIDMKESFFYIHLYMPHSPMRYEPEFKLKVDNNFEDYIEYWHFANKKLEILLNKLVEENKYRIILTGDHGYRGEKTMNPKYTFSAYYGFDDFELERIQSVQDIGSLINAAF